MNPHLGYRPWLDGLRGIAISLVFVHHIQHFIYQGGPIFGWLFLPFGNLGVDVFFVLSGFLITTLLLEEYDRNSDIGLKNFYIRRALRLLPALVVFLICMVAYSRLFMPSNDANWTAKLSLIALFYGTNWVLAFGDLGSDLLGHLWSLAVEEQFYLLWPLALSLLLRSRLSKRTMALSVLAIAVIVCLYRVLLIWAGVASIRIYAASDTRADSLLIGCCVAMLVSWRLILPSARTIRVAGVFSALIIAAYVLDLFSVAKTTMYTTGFTAFALAVGGFIFCMMSIRSDRYIRLLENPALVWIGKLSYSLYLWHFFTIGVTLLIPVPSAARVAFSIPISLAFAASSYYLIEHPFLRLKSRYASTLDHSSRVTRARIETVVQVG